MLVAGGGRLIVTGKASDGRPLAGLRVIDIATYIAAPYCATLMAEFGAEVIKVEQPGVGDPCRRLGTVAECGDTLVWLSEARNKKSVTLNLKSPKGAAILKQLVARTDALTENFQPGHAGRLGPWLGRVERRQSAPRDAAGLGLRPDRPLQPQAGASDESAMPSAAFPSSRAIPMGRR
jgi:hypothetical protein